MHPTVETKIRAGRRRHPRRRGRVTRRRRIPRVTEAAARPAAPTREADSAAALLRQHDAIADCRRSWAFPRCMCRGCSPAHSRSCAPGCSPTSEAGAGLIQVGRALSRGHGPTDVRRPARPVRTRASDCGRAPSGSSDIPAAALPDGVTAIGSADQSPGSAAVSERTAVAAAHRAARARSAPPRGPTSDGHAHREPRSEPR